MTNTMRILLFFCLFPLSLAAQFGFGIKGGLPVTYSATQTSVGSTVRLDSSSRNYIIGGMAELRLPFGVSIEGDLLYHPFNLRRTVNGATTITNYNVLEVPVVAKLKLGKGLAAPYVEGGASLRTKPSQLVSDINGVVNGNLSPVGVTLGAGIEIKALLVRISPEFRYTRWGRGALTTSGGYVDQQNQAAILVGISF